MSIKIAIAASQKMLSTVISLLDLIGDLAMPFARETLSKIPSRAKILSRLSVASHVPVKKMSIARKADVDSTTFGEPVIRSAKVLNSASCSDALPLETSRITSIIEGPLPVC